MLATVLAGLVLGYGVGLRYRVMILVPVEMLALLAGLASGLSGAAAWVSALAGFAVFSLGLQGGYLTAVAVPGTGRRTPVRRAEA